MGMDVLDSEGLSALWTKIKNTFATKDVVSSATNGLVPKVTDTSKYLRGDGTWSSPPNDNTWRPLGTGANDACAGNDSRLSNARPASDVYAWAKASTKPSYHAGELGVAPFSYKVSSVSAGFAPYISDIGTNIFSGATSSEITIERSTDDGATWSNTTEAEAAQIKNVFSGCVTGTITVSSRTKGAVGDKLRITFYPTGGTRYCQLSFIYIYFSTNGCACSCNVEKSWFSDKTHWDTIITDAPIGGWSGPNVMGCESTIFGQGDNRNNGYGLRFTFRINAVHNDYDSKGYIYSIQGFTSNRAWGVPSGNSIARQNTPYSYTNADRAVVFDNTITAPTFIGALSGTASNATNNANGKELTNSIIKGLSINGKTITYTQIDGSTGTLTTQDTTYSSKSATSGGTDVSLVTTGEKYTWEAKQNAITSSNKLAYSLVSGTPTKLSDFTDDLGTSPTHTHSQYLTGITSSQVTTALGFTPYNSTNPNGYTSNTGTVTSVKLKAGTGIALDSYTAITTSGEREISLSSTYQTYCTNGNTAYGWGNHANAGYVTLSGTQTITGAKTFSSDLNVTGNVISSKGVSASGIHDMNMTVSGTASWGDISGTITDQTDLMGLLNAKGTYSKPSSGIPMSDLSATVQNQINSSYKSEAWTAAGSTTQLASLYYRKVGDMVWFKGKATSVSFTASQSGYTTLFTLPEGYRPTAEYMVRIVNSSFSTSTATYVEISVTTSGVVRLLPIRYNGGTINAAQTVNVYFNNISFFID